MATAEPDWASPQFCLGGTIYPVPPDFDWTHDKDVLLDALRETRTAMQTHHWCRYTPDRDWLDCECLDPAAHEELLQAGLFMLIGTAMTMSPDAARSPRQAFRFPVLSQYLRMVQVALFAILTTGTLLTNAADLVA